MKLDADFSQLLNTMSRAGYATPEELHHYGERLELLVKEADLEDDPVSCDSFINLSQFMADVSADHSLLPGTLSLMANGDFRVEWGSPQKDFVGIRFLASGEFKCVLFKKGEEDNIKQSIFSSWRDVLDFISSKGFAELVVAG